MSKNKKIIYGVLAIVIILGGIIIYQQSPSNNGQKTPSLDTFDLNSLPIIEDCRETTNEEEWEDIQPSDEQLELINKKGAMLISFQIKPNYQIGRIRAEMHGLPYGYSCLSYFDIGIINKKNNQPTGIKEAFIFKEENLPKIGWLLYGEPKNREDILKGYKRAQKMNSCEESKLPCLREKIADLPLVEDGVISIKDKSWLLHRFTSSCGPDQCLYYKKLSIRPDGSLNIEEQQIYYIRTGIMW